MNIKVTLEHRTSYTFNRLVQVCPHVVRVHLAPHSRPPIEAHSLQIEPAGHFINCQQDTLGNGLTRLVLPNPMRRRSIGFGLITNLKMISPFDCYIENWAETWPATARSGPTFTYPEALAEDLKPYLRPVDEAGNRFVDNELVWAWIRNFPVPDGIRTINFINFLVAFNQAMNAEVSDIVCMEHGVPTTDFTLRTGISSCRDSAWLLVSILWQMRLTAWVVSSSATSYNCPPISRHSTSHRGLPPNSPTCTPGPKCPSPVRAKSGWTRSRGCSPTRSAYRWQPHHILRRQRRPTAQPTRAKRCWTSLTLSTQVQEDPHITLPYSDVAWHAICAIGQHGYQRLTVGGKPTVVLVNIHPNKGRKEWTMVAKSPSKRQPASDLTARLKAAWAPQGLIHFRQGQWYTGEPLPQWQITLYWRTKGQPLWTNDALLTDTWKAGPSERNKTTLEDSELAHKVLAQAADGLGLPLTQMRAAYKDTLRRLAAKVRIPSGAPVQLSDDRGPTTPDSAVNRVALLTRLEESVTLPDAYMLSLHSRDDNLSWVQATLQLHRGCIVLIEDASLAGLLLPLDSISWPRPHVSFYLDPMTFWRAWSAEPNTAAAVLENPDSAPPTAMVAEIRGEFLSIFLSPTETLKHFVSLVSGGETAAANIGCPVVIEGYGLPTDLRLKSMCVKPGQVAAAASFAAERQQLETFYAQAGMARLSTESFDDSGAHGRTGGNNHITLGDVTPLRRHPDLLVSLLTCWQRHPSRSYRFAGQFVGPISQAPQVDEVRAFRHLVVDITGNIHHAEFCIDKLHSHDNTHGRLSLLELRGFAMPLYLQMVIVRWLLVRSLVAWFWEEPLRASVIRHGTNLHGRYLFPHFVSHDMAAIATSLREHGLAFETNWLYPFIEFRLPRLGTSVFHGVEIELRNAIEPWTTFGEKSTVTSRGGCTYHASHTGSKAINTGSTLEAQARWSRRFEATGFIPSKITMSCIRKSKSVSPPTSTRLASSTSDASAP